MPKDKAPAAKPATKEVSFKFGVDDLADKMGIEGASVRIKLRNAGIAKAATGRYGWNTKSELDEIAKKLGEVKAAPTKKADSKPAGKKADAKTDAKSTGKKPAAAANDAKAGAKKKAA